MNPRTIRPDQVRTGDTIATKTGTNRAAFLVVEVIHPPYCGATWVFGPEVKATDHTVRSGRQRREQLRSNSTITLLERGTR